MPLAAENWLLRVTSALMCGGLLGLHYVFVNMLLSPFEVILTTCVSQNICLKAILTLFEYTT